jgi:hypothetical protein
MRVYSALFVVAAVLATAAPLEASGPVQVREAADELVCRVAAYTRGNPDAPGAFAPWSGDVALGDPILVYRYQDLSPSYCLIPVLDGEDGANSLITLDAATGDWQAYCELRDRAPFPAVSRERASTLVCARLGTHCEPTELLAVSMPNRKIYWRFDSSGDEAFVSIQDERDVRVGVDAELNTPLNMGRRTEDGSGAPHRVEPKGPGDVHQVPAEEPIARDRRDEGTPADRRYPTSYDIEACPHYYQGTGYHCGPASLEMVFDYWGVHVNQTDIGYACYTTQYFGTYADDMRRAAHFSDSSTAPGDPTLHGYDERWHGYAAAENQWSYPSAGSDPDYVDRYTDLKNLISSDYPVIVLTHYDASHTSGHFRVIKGYDDNTDVFIVHDPWYDPPYEGPNVHFNQTFFVDDLWNTWYRWGLFTAPWFLDYTMSPDPPPRGKIFEFSLHVEYPGPHPFEGEYDVGTSARAYLGQLGDYEFVPDQTHLKELSGISTTGTSADASWYLIAPCEEEPSPQTFANYACGEVSGTSTMSGSYTDEIGDQPDAEVQASSEPNVIVVDVNGGAYRQIQLAIDTLPCEGDRVSVMPGTYTGEGNKDIDFGGTNYEVIGSGSVTIDCQNSGRAFYFHSGEDTTSLLRNLTIKRGNPTGADTYGGGILCEGASPKLRSITLRQNQADYGGGMAWVNGAPILDNVYIQGNTAQESGGGVYSAPGAAGGCVLRDALISGNDAGSYGGGIYGTSHGDVVLRDNVIGPNSSQFGGGMYLDGADLEIRRCLIVGNGASEGGGALYMTNHAGPDIVRTTIVDNMTSNAAYAALESDDSNPHVWETIISDNVGGGGGMNAVGTAQPSVDHCVSYANEGGNDFFGTSYDCLITNPYFCQPHSEYTLHTNSPCMPDHNPWGLLIGCYGEGDCGYAGLDDGELPTRRLALLASAPNPFDRESTILYEAPETDEVLSVCVYDLSGRLVRKLYEGPAGGGREGLVWDGTDDSGLGVAGGVYFLRAELGRDSVGRKLVVLR